MTRSCHSERSEESETDKNRNRMFNKLYKMKKIEGKLSAQGQRIGIVAARFNEFITSKLLSGAEDSFVRHGGNTDDLEVAWVPGSFEIPLVAKKMADSGRYDAVVCLGAVMVIFGVLTTDSIEQAVERAGTKAGNKGFDAMTTAIEMVDLLRQF